MSEASGAAPVAPAEGAPAAESAPVPARPVPPDPPQGSPGRAESRTPTGRSPDPRTPVPPQEAARRAPGGDQEAPPKTDGSWLQRFLRPGTPGPAEKALSQPASESAPGGPSGPQETPDTEPPSPWTAPASREEEERRVQAEVDRRAARAQKQQAQQTRAQQRAVLEQQAQALKQQGDQAYDTDAYQSADAFKKGYALEQQAQALTAQEQFVAGLVGAYDQSTLDPLVSALPEAERGALLQDAPTGMEGRKALVEKAVTAIKATSRAEGAREAEARLRKSAAFRKQVLADWRRGLHGEEDAPDEPELVGGSGTNGHRGGPSMNDWLRAHR